jgi:hypothetical protein
MKISKITIERRWLEIAAADGLVLFHSPDTPIESAYWGKTPKTKSQKDYQLASLQDFLGDEPLGQILVDGEYADDDDRQYSIEVLSKTGEVWSLLRSTKSQSHDDIFQVQCSVLESLDLRFKTMLRKEQILDEDKRSRKFFWILDQEFPLFAVQDEGGFALYEVIFKP